MAKVIWKGWSKPSDQIPQPLSVTLGGNLRPNSEQQSQPKPENRPSPTQLEERARLVAAIQRRHPQATTEQIVRELEAWGE